MAGADDAKRKGRASLRVELIVMLTIVLVMAVVSLSFTAEWLGQRRHDQQEVERLQAHARGLAMLASRVFGEGDFQRDALEALLFESSAQLGASYEVHRVRNDGALELLASVGVHVGFEALPPPPTELASQVDDRLLDRYQLLVIDEPIPTHGQQRVNLRLIAEHSAWARSHAWRDMLFVAGGVGLLLLVLGGLLLELQVLRPLRALEAAVARVGSGSLDARAPTDGPRELAEFATAFNDMLGSLRDQQGALARQAQQLERSERLAAVGRLSAGVAHEVGNPLAAIVGYTEIMLDEPELDAENKDLLERVQTQTQRIQGIVSQLLDYSKPTTLRCIAFAPVARAQEVLRLLEADSRCAGVVLEVVGDPEHEAHADPSLFEQILLNLVLNAVQAMREAHVETPRVRVVVRPDPERAELRIEVRDEGPGVAEDIQARLFEPFFTTRGAGEGTGLGLAISQGLAESMEGSLEYIADARARGAVFRLTLPRAD